MMERCRPREASEIDVRTRREQELDDVGAWGGLDSQSVVERRESVLVDEVDQTDDTFPRGSRRARGEQRGSGDIHVGDRERRGWEEKVFERDDVRGPDGAKESLGIEVVLLGVEKQDRRWDCVLRYRVVQLRVERDESRRCRKMLDDVLQGAKDAKSAPTSAEEEKSTDPP